MWASRFHPAGEWPVRLSYRRNRPFGLSGSAFGLNTLRGCRFGEKPFNMLAVTSVLQSSKRGVYHKPYDRSLPGQGNEGRE
jgi:hypothetical protein